MAPKTCSNVIAALVVATIASWISLSSYAAGKHTNISEGRHVISKDWIDNDMLGAIGNDGDAVVLQTNHTVIVGDGNHALGSAGHAAAYLLDGGSLAIQNGHYWRFHGDYTLFRQTGGTFRTVDYPLWRPATDNSEDTLPGDFIFGGSADASFRIDKRDDYIYSNSYNMVVMDGAVVNLPSAVGMRGGMSEYKRVFAINGGMLTADPYNGMSTNTVWSFNGGIYRATKAQPGYTANCCFFGASQQNALNPYVRVYENGGVILHDQTNPSSSYMIDLPNILEPVGNVVLSVELTDAAANNNGAGWDCPPAVVINDTTGLGSNAVAFVNYDYDSRTITNITIACRGENYSDVNGAVKAELRYKATGEALHSLVCGVGPCQGGDFSFGGGYYSHTMRMGSAEALRTTNTYHGATIVDMDPEGLRESETSRIVGGVLEIDGQDLFENSGRVIVRSGVFYSSFPDRAFSNIFPACTNLALYGGHCSVYNRSSYSNLGTVTVGGAAKLDNRGTNADTHFRLAVTDALYVDVACMTNGVTPSLTNGRIKFNEGAKVSVENWDKIPRGGEFRVFLDLSGTTVNRNPNNATIASDVCTPEIMMPDGSEGDLALKWEFDDDNQPLRLLGRRLANGMMLIFR